MAEPTPSVYEDAYVGARESIAKHIVWELTSGLCALGKVCALCDCFADADGGAYRDQVARDAADAALGVWRRDR